jgi:hypothetical protein
VTGINEQHREHEIRNSISSWCRLGGDHLAGNSRFAVVVSDDRADALTGEVRASSTGAPNGQGPHAQQLVDVGGHHLYRI